MTTTPFSRWVRISLLVLLLFLLAAGGGFWIWRRMSFSLPHRTVSKVSGVTPTPTPVSIAQVEPTKNILGAESGTVSANPVRPTAEPTLVVVVTPAASLNPTVTMTLAPSATPGLSPSATPTSKPTPTSQPTPTPIPAVPTPVPTIQPALTNGDFSRGLTGWQVLGQVSVLPVVGDSSAPQPSGQFLARLASKTDLGWLGSHQLIQTFQVNPSAKVLDFWYRLWTEETNLGFDDPALVVTLDNQVIWRVGAAAAWPAAGPGWQAPVEPFKTSWQLVSIPLEQLLSSNGPHTLKFLAGQAGDQTQATWADIAGVELVSTVAAGSEQPIPTTWPTQLALEWTEFTQAFSSPVTYFVGQLADITSPPVWGDLVTQLQAPVEWQGHALTDLVKAQVNNWQPAQWLVNASQLQPSFDFPFSLSHDGFTGPVTADAAPGQVPPQPPSPPASWMSWDTILNVLKRPQNLLWLDLGAQ